MDETLRELLSDNILQVWKDLECEVRSLYDMDQLWNKGFGDWEIEYKLSMTRQNRSMMANGYGYRLMKKQLKRCCYDAENQEEAK